MRKAIKVKVVKLKLPPKRKFCSRVAVMFRRRYNRKVITMHSFASYVYDILSEALKAQKK